MLSQPSPSPPSCARPLAIPGHCHCALFIKTMMDWRASKVDAQKISLLVQFWIDNSLGKLRWSLLGPKEETPRPTASEVMSFVPSHLAGFRIPTHPFLREPLRVYELRLHDLMLHGVIHLAVFVTLCECYLGL